MFMRQVPAERGLLFEAQQHRLYIAKDIVCKYNVIWKNGSFRNTENLQYKKTADSVLLSMFMRPNGKCNNSHAPYHRLYSLFMNIKWNSNAVRFKSLFTLHGGFFRVKRCAL